VFANRHAITRVFANRHDPHETARDLLDMRRFLNHIPRNVKPKTETLGRSDTSPIPIWSVERSSTCASMCSSRRTCPSLSGCTAGTEREKERERDVHTPLSHHIISLRGREGEGTEGQTRDGILTRFIARTPLLTYLITFAHRLSYPSISGPVGLPASAPSDIRM
jgi:hypothetical protein